MNQALNQELDEVMTGLDAYVRTSGTRIVKSVEVRDDEQEDTVEFPATRQGLAEFAQGDSMRDLLRRDPVEFRKSYLDFCIGAELVLKGEATPQEISMWGQQLALLPARSRSTPSSFSKAVQHAEPSPRPWDFTQDARGHEGFLHSPEMVALEKARPGMYRNLALDFYVSMQPMPSPVEVGVRRQELEQMYPDNPAASTVAKSVRQAGGHLTTGQSVLVSNFGSMADPANWLK